MALIWKPIEDIPTIETSDTVEFLHGRLRQWDDVRRRLEAKKMDWTYLDIWRRERNRRFVIGTGEVEGLYTLKEGVTEQFITEGFTGVKSAHVHENIELSTLKGLLGDQEETLEDVFSMVKNGERLSQPAIRALHQKVTRHQETAPGVDQFGRRTSIALLRGQYKVRPNNPRREDGEIHPYCPPEQTQIEMDRLLEMHQEHEDEGVDVLIQAAWLHHRFVQIHPFQDGNGRTARLLMAYVFIKGGGFPPVINNLNKPTYIRTLERANKGDFQAFVDFLANESSNSVFEAINIGESILSGVRSYRHSNQGITLNEVYYPPGTPEADCMNVPVIEQKPPLNGKV